MGVGWEVLLRIDRSPFRILLCAFLVALPACSLLRNNGGADGYQTRSYTIRGIRYHPMSVERALSYSEVGIASWYNESKYLGLVRGDTSLGEKVMPWDMIAAHKTLPLPSLVRVTHVENGRSVVLRVNDRGPFIAGRIIDLSPRAAKKLDFREDGLARVRVEVLSVGDGEFKRKPPKKKRWWWPF